MDSSFRHSFEFPISLGTSQQTCYRTASFRFLKQYVHTL